MSYSYFSTQLSLQPAEQQSLILNCRITSPMNALSKRHYTVTDTSNQFINHIKSIPECY